MQGVKALFYRDFCHLEQVMFQVTEVSVFLAEGIYQGAETLMFRAAVMPFVKNEKTILLHFASMNG